MRFFPPPPDDYPNEYPPYRVRWPGRKPGQDTTVYAYSWREMGFRLAQHVYYGWRYPIDM